MSTENEQQAGNVNKAKDQAGLPASGGSVASCACVSHDAHECARIRDGIDPDDEHFMSRECECCCHHDEDSNDDEI
jgi:hypothetical protein